MPDEPVSPGFIQNDANGSVLNLSGALEDESVTGVDSYPFQKSLVSDFERENGFSASRNPLEIFLDLLIEEDLHT